MVNVIILNVIMLNVVAPFDESGPKLLPSSVRKRFQDFLFFSFSFHFFNRVLLKGTQLWPTAVVEQLVEQSTNDLKFVG